MTVPDSTGTTQSLTNKIISLAEKQQEIIENFTNVVKQAFPHPPIGLIDSPNVISKNQEIIFSAEQSRDLDGIIETYEWSFGDGKKDFGIKVSHTYSQSGTYTVTLTLIDNDGNSSSKTKKIVVQD